MIVGTTDDLELLFREYKMLVIAIGNNEVRKKLYKKGKQIGYSFPNIVCDTAYISSFAKVGEGCVFLNNVVVQNGAQVGNATILNPGVDVHHDSVVGDFCCIYSNSVIRTYAKVGNCVKVGSNVTIKNETSVCKDVDDGETI